jgi:hypothetical protein
MKAKLTAFLDQLILHDYLLFGGSILLFILFLILAVLLRDRLAPALLCVFAAFAILVLGPTLGYVKLHEHLYKHEIEVTEVKKLVFTDALLVQGSLTNTSSRPFSRCRISAEIYKVAHHSLLDLYYPLDPLQTGSAEKEDIPQNGRVTFKIFVEPFSYTSDYNVSIGAKCH